MHKDLSVFNCIECKWTSYCKDKDEDNKFDPLIFNLMEFSPWDGCAPILYSKIYLINNSYFEPGLDIDRFSWLRPKVAILSYNLNALRPPKPTDLMYMTLKRITGLHKYLTNPWKVEYETGVVVPLGRGGRFCYVAYFSNDNYGFNVSIHAAVFNLRLDHIKDDFPNEVEKVTLRTLSEKLPDKYVVKETVRVREELPEELTDYCDGDVVIDEPVLCPQGAVVESFYECAHKYVPWVLQVGQDYVAK